MGNWRDAVLREYKELNDKISDLQTFLINLNEDDISPTQKYLLEAQLRAMQTYSNILVARLELK